MLRRLLYYAVKAFIDKVSIRLYVKHFFEIWLILNDGRFLLLSKIPPLIISIKLNQNEYIQFISIEKVRH